MAGLSTDYKENLTMSVIHQDQELRITNYELRITNYELRITNYELRMGNG
jgi:hypothetical protein